jgi:glutamate-1-semialdehyde aminotransferase
MEVQRNFNSENNFLQKVRNLCTKKNIILIFDECTSGFRESLGGIHLNHKVNPDMMILGKALGNGYAINAILGKKEIMRFAEKTFISSTFWSERSGPSAALKTLEIMEKTKSWKLITKKGIYIRNKWKKMAKKYKLS